MRLPARTEGPHCWLWLLLYREADAGLRASTDSDTRTRAAGLLWDQVVAGSLCVKRDRSGLTQETDPWLPDLIRAEARRHLALSAQLHHARDVDDNRRVEVDRPEAERVDAIAQFMWRQLGTGWGRVADDDAVLFWDPETSAFVPFCLELSATYIRLFGT